MFCCRGDWKSGERRKYTPPVAIVTPMRIRISKFQQTDGRFSPLRRWDPHPHIPENWKSTPASLPSSDGVRLKDAATNVHIIDIVNGHKEIDMFVNDEQLAPGVNVVQKRPDVFHLYDIRDSWLKKN